MQVSGTNQRDRHLPEISTFLGGLATCQHPTVTSICTHRHLTVKCANSKLHCSELPSATQLHILSNSVRRSSCLDTLPIACSPCQVQHESNAIWISATSSTSLRNGLKLLTASFPLHPYMAGSSQRQPTLVMLRVYKAG